jgi:putative sterol carrier protein
MVYFPSDEWIQIFKEELNKNKTYYESAKGWEGDFLFIITPDSTLKEEVIFYVDLWHGKCRKAHIVDGTKTAAYIFAGPYSHWKKMIKNEIDPLRGVIRGMFTINGDSKILVEQAKAAQELVKTASKIPTEFEDSANDKNR